MPRILFSLAAEIHKPLAIPGSPDIAGELTLEAPSDTIRTGTGQAWVSGWASTSVYPDRLDLPRTRVEFAGRKCVVPISTSKAQGKVTVHAWEWFEKADAAANLRAMSGLLSGRDIEATGTLGAVKAERWEPTAQPDAPDIGPQVPHVAVHATTFLRSGARVTSHVLMSPSLTDAQRAELIAYNNSHGYGVLYVYAANEGDYGRKAVRYSGERDVWRLWLGEVVKSGARVIMWGCADDSPGLAKWTPDQWRAYWGRLHADCGDLISEWVTGLECDERWSAGTTQTLTRLLKQITGKPVGVHTTGLSKVGHAAGADAFYLQTGFGKSPAQVADLVRAARAKFSGRVIAAEYHKSGETAEAKAIGDAAIAAGADGVGNGCTAQGLATLRGGSPSTPGTPPAATGLTFTAGTARRYVRWSPAVDRTGWPIAKKIKGQPDGLLYGRRKGETTWRKVEWILPGKQETGLKNAYDDVNDPKYDLGWAPSEAVELQIRDTTGRVRADWHQGGWVLR